MAVDDTNRMALAKIAEENVDTKFSVDISNLKIRAGEFSCPCELRPGARDSLLNGSWDPLDELLQSNDEIEQVNKSLAYT